MESKLLANAKQKRSQFGKDLQSVWDEVDLECLRGVNLFPNDPVNGDSSGVENESGGQANHIPSGLKSHSNTNNATQLLSAEKFLPDSAPCSSYGVGEYPQNISHS